MAKKYAGKSAMQELVTTVLDRGRVPDSKMAQSFINALQKKDVVSEEDEYYKDAVNRIKKNETIILDYWIWNQLVQYGIKKFKYDSIGGNKYYEKTQEFLDFLEKVTPEARIKILEWKQQDNWFIPIYDTY